MAAFTNVENKLIKFLLKQPVVQGAIQFPKNTMVVYQYLGEVGYLGSVPRKSRNFTNHFWVKQFPLYLKNGEDLSRQTSQPFFFLLPLKHVKISAFQSKWLAV